MIERHCLWCREPFTVDDPASTRRYCCRTHGTKMQRFRKRARMPGACPWPKKDAWPTRIEALFEWEEHSKGAVYLCECGLYHYTSKRDGALTVDDLRLAWEAGFQAGAS